VTCSITCLLTKPTFSDFLYGKLIALVPFVTALIAIVRYSDTIMWPLLYVVIFLTHATHIYFKKCSHRAYYKTGGRTLRCHYIWGLPKILKARSTPISGYLRIYTPIAVFVISAFPIYWLLFQWELLLVYALSWGVLMGSIIHECTRCTYLECSMNRVLDDVKNEYLKTIII
jgi:hypothetical protein